MREILIILMAVVFDILGRFRRWLTFRRVLGIVAVLILVLCLKGIIFDMGMGADLPILFGIDWGLAIEVSALLIALTVRGHVMTVAYMARRNLLRLKPVGLLLRRGFQRAFRSRSARPLLPPPPDDEPAAWAFA